MEKNELSDYFKLISLLHKERPLRYKEIVEDIIKRESDNDKRIRKIYEVDNRIEKEKTGQPRVETDIIHKNKTIPPNKKKLKPSGFFSFLFFNRKMVINFSERTETIELSFFGLKKELSSMSEVMWEELYENTKKYMIAPVSALVQKGWLSLDITSYNLIVAFDKFLKNFIRYGEDISATRTSTENLRSIEGFLPYYLKIIFVREYREILEESISEFTITDKRFKSNYKYIRRLIKEFLDVESRSLCFFNIINAVFITHYNRFIKLADMCKSYGVEDINHFKYEFSNKIEKEVKDYIKNIEHKYNKAESELFFLKFIHEIKFDSKEDNYIVQMINKTILYEFVSSKNSLEDVKQKVENADDNSKLKNVETNPFSYLKKDLPKYLLKFITGFRIIYKKVLTEKITIRTNDGDEKQIILFKDNPFKENFDKISEYTREMSLLMQNEKLNVTSSMYLTYLERKLLNTQEAEKMCQNIEQVVEQFYLISDKLSMVLYRNYKASGLDAGNLLEAYKKQNEPLNISEDKSQLIPYSFDQLVNDRYHNYDKIIDILNEIMELTVNTAYLMKYQSVLERLAKKPELINDSEYYVKIKSKIIN